jgi:ribosomal protein S18 acetylase RimI-like enzyme
MPSEIEVREANEEDAEAIYSLACELANTIGDSDPEPDAVRNRLLELLEAPSAHTLVAEGEESIVGLVSFWIKPDLAHGDIVVEIPILAVAKEARRHGIGKLLIERTRDVASEHDSGLIELIATPNNTIAQKFYRSLGFVETDHIALEFRGDLEDPPDSDKQ